MRLLFIRHGDPDYEHDSLTPKGEREAELLADKMEGEQLTHIYISPLGRAQRTAVSPPSAGRSAPPRRRSGGCTARAPRSIGCANLPIPSACPIRAKSTSSGISCPRSCAGTRSCTPPKAGRRRNLSATAACRAPMPPLARGWTPCLPNTAMCGRGIVNQVKAKRIRSEAGISPHLHR